MIADCRQQARRRSLGRAAGCWLSKSTVSGDVFDACFWRQLVRDGCLDLWSSARGSGTVSRCALFPCQVLRAFAPSRETLLRSGVPHPVRTVSREGAKARRTSCSRCCNCVRASLHALGLVARTMLNASVRRVLKKGGVQEGASPSGGSAVWVLSG